LELLRFSIGRKLVYLMIAWVLAAQLGVAAVAADLFVLRVGDGTQSRTNASTAVVVDRFTTTGDWLETIDLPTSASESNQPLTISGTASSEGFISLSPDGQYLTLGGYAAPPGVNNVSATSAGSVNRVVGRIDLDNGNAVDTSTVLTDGSFTGSNIRSAATSNGTDLWVAGNSSPGLGGVRHTTLGSGTTTLVNDNPDNVRVVNIYGGQLYVSSGIQVVAGVAQIGVGLPTTMAQTALLPGMESNEPPFVSSYDFWFRDSRTLYVADDRSAANGGGIQKWELDAGAWNHSYTFNIGTGARGLTGTVEDGDTVLFATTTQLSSNHIVSLMDVGPSATANIITTAPADTAFRGLAMLGSTAPLADGDFDGNGIVDGADFLLWQQGSSPDPLSLDDLAAWEANFGSGATMSTVAPVPEPSSLGLLLAAGVLWGLGRRFERNHPLPGTLSFSNH